MNVGFAVDDMSDFTSEQNTEISLGDDSNNEAYAEIFEDYSPPPYQVDTDVEEASIDDRFS